MNNLWKIYEKEPLEFINNLIHVPSMQRLKDIGMNCGVEYTAFDFFSNIVPYSRYQHSIGVALIVYHFSHDLRHPYVKSTTKKYGGFFQLLKAS